MTEKIKDIEIKVLREKCVDLIAKTFMELDQKPSEEDLVNKALTLTEDLKEDFGTLTFEDIRKAFRSGVRNTDKFLVNPKTYYGWIKSWRQIIWDNDGKTENIDKRLSYRTRQGTGTKQLKTQIIKQLNYGNRNN